jgi:hypothetical protein
LTAAKAADDASRAADAGADGNAAKADDAQLGHRPARPPHDQA